MKKTSVKKTGIPPLLCWDIYYPFYQKMLNNTYSNFDLQRLTKLSVKYKWKANLNEILRHYSYTALVLTDEAQKIIWVNNGFSEMTGYSKSFAINRTPVFLQGENTSEEVKARIRRQIEKREPFKEVLINYRKDGSPYKCEVQTFLLKGNNTIHFLALEREVA